LITEHPAARPEANLGFAPVDNELPLLVIAAMQVPLGHMLRKLVNAVL